MTITRQQKFILSAVIIAGALVAFLSVSTAVASPTLTTVNTKAAISQGSLGKDNRASSFIKNIFATPALAKLQCTDCDDGGGGGGSGDDGGGGGDDGGSNPPADENGATAPELLSESEAYDRSGEGNNENLASHINFSDRLSSGEYVDKVSFDLKVSNTYCAGDTKCTVDAYASGHVPGVGTKDLRIKKNNTTSGEVSVPASEKTKTYTFNLSPSTGGADDRIDFQANTSATRGDSAGIHGIAAKASVKNIVISTAPLSGGSTNNPPVAVDDGTPSDRICTQVGVDSELGVLKNDSDPDGDPLTISNITTYPGRGSATIGADDSGTPIIRYTPSATGNDSFVYEISDGNGGTGSATVYVDNRSGCGYVTAHLGGDLSASVKEKTIIHPRYNGSYIAQQNLSAAETNGWNVDLYTDPKIFAIERSNVSVADGYELDLPSWISKEIDIPDDLPQNEAELGLSYDYPSGCSGDPTPGTNEPPAADAFWNLNQRGGSGDSYEYRYNLSANASSDPDCDTLTYFWEITSITGNDAKPAAFIPDNSAKITLFDITDEPGVPGQADAYVTYNIRLTVDDGEFTDTEDISITITCSQNQTTGAKECTAPDSGT